MHVPTHAHEGIQMTFIVPGIIQCSQSNSYVSILFDNKAKLNRAVN